MSVQRGDLRGAVLVDRTGEADVGSATGWHAPSVFAADTHTGADYLGRTASAAFLAEVVAHRNAETPFSIGIFGPPGSGKSSFLAGLLAAVERLDEAARDAGLATPFLPNLAVARVQAEGGPSPALSLMQQVAAALEAGHPRLAAEAGHAGLDPRTVSRRASDTLLDVRQRLDVERRNLDGLRGRQARLPEALLFETPGSMIDEHTRRHRGRIERTMRGFGFDDTLTAYKTAVLDTSQHESGVGRWMAGLRAFWAYRGQGRLLAVVVVLLLAAWGIGVLDADQDRLVDLVRGGGDKLGSTADWLAAHWHWLVSAKSLLELAAVAALALNVLRGIRYLLPVHRGTRLLQGELETRRRELDGLLAHHTRRVDTLAREADSASQHAAEAETQAAKVGVGTAVPPLLDAAGQAANHQGIGVARTFFAAVEQAMRAGSQDRLASSTSAAPSRMVVGIDGLDDLPASEAASFLQTARNLLARPGFVIVAASDRFHLLNGLAEADPALATAWLNRLVQIPYTLSDGGAFGDAASFARALLDSETPNAPSSPTLTTDGRVSALDRPWTEAETAVVEALAPFAGGTPRAVKRFVNLYRVARADPRMNDATPKDMAALAIGLALQSAGSPADPRQVPTSGDMEDEARPLRKAASTALATPLSALDGGLGYDTARVYSAGR